MSTRENIRLIARTPLVCGCILGWRSVVYHFQVTVTLTSNQVFRIIVSGAYLISFEVGIPILVCGCILG